MIIDYIKINENIRERICGNLVDSENQIMENLIIKMTSMQSSMWFLYLFLYIYINRVLYNIKL